MSEADAIVLAETRFKRIARQYRRRWGVSLCCIDPQGRRVHGRPGCGAEAGDCTAVRLMALQETLRWGEATVQFCPKKRLLWAVPLMHNAALVGGLVATATERQVFAGTDGRAPIDPRGACVDLRELLERENLTNAAALALRRARYQSEQERAYALHAYKEYGHAGIRELYLREEPALFSAVRAGDRGQARAILNRILVAIHYHAGNRIEAIKSFFLELVVSMCRTAVDAGGDPEELLGANFRSMVELSGIGSEEELAPWLASTLEHLMDAIQRHRRRDSGQALHDAIAYMERHCCERIGRDDVARAAHLSPSHFSALIRSESGATFTQLLNRMRIDRAAELLARTDKPLALIALETGFQDQSYFTKVFKRYRKTAPLQYRRERAAEAAAG